MYRQKTLDPHSKCAVFDYLMRLSYKNKQNYKNFKYTTLNEYWFMNNIVIYTKKNFYLLKEINKIISTLKSNGLINHWVAEQTVLDMKVSRSSGPNSLNLTQLQGIFEVWIYGIIVSITCLLLENIFHKIKSLNIKLFRRKGRVVQKRLYIE